jgi:hypothetical protein
MRRVIQTRQHLLYESSRQQVEGSLLLIDRSYLVWEEAAAHRKRRLAPFARPAQQKASERQARQSAEASAWSEKSA